MNNITEEIKELKYRLDHFDDTNPKYISPRIAQLTHRIIVTHARIESAINFFMVLSLTEGLFKYLPYDINVTFGALILLFIQECKMDFGEKIEYLIRNKSIPDKIAQKARGVNTLRNKFAHPDKNYNVLKAYDSDIMVKNILKQLFNARKEIERYFSNEPKEKIIR